MEKKKVAIFGRNVAAFPVFVGKLLSDPSVEICGTIMLDDSQPEIGGIRLINDFNRFFALRPQAVAVIASPEDNLDAVMQSEGEGIKSLFLLSPVANEDEDRRTIFDLCRHLSVNLTVATLDEIESTSAVERFIAGIQ